MEGALAYGVASVPMLIFPAVCAQLRASAVASLVLMLSALAAALISAMYSPIPVLQRVSGLLIHILPLVAVMIVGAALSQAVGIAEVVDAQSRVQFAWHVFDNPFSLLTALLAIRLLWPALLGAESSSPAGTFGRWLLATAGAIAIAGYSLGGWPLKELDMLSLPLRVAGASLIFAAKAMSVLLVARLVARVHRSDRRKSSSATSRDAIRAVLLVVSAAAACAWNYFQIPPDIAAAGTSVAVGGFLFVSLRFALTKMRRFRADSVVTAP